MLVPNDELLAPKAGAEVPKPCDEGVANKAPAGCDCPKKPADPNGEEDPRVAGELRLVNADPVKGAAPPNAEVPNGAEPKPVDPNAAPLAAPKGDGDDAPNAEALACPKAEPVEGEANGD